MKKFYGQITIFKMLSFQAATYYSEQVSHKTSQRSRVSYLRCQVHKVKGEILLG